MREYITGEFPCSSLTHQMLVDKMEMDLVGWVFVCTDQLPYCYFKCPMFVCVTQLLLFQVFSGHMKV